MASIVQRLKAFLSSPSGQRAVERGRRELSKPQNQQKLRQLAARFNKRR
ncbi:MAG TPA: hypothetical protein VK453_29035 [Micromonosporaceae bacterium]|nr:hypothetical protein [Micromonosporaceae bacterium]